MTNEEYDSHLQNLAEQKAIIIDAETLAVDPAAVGWFDGVCSAFGVPVIYFNWKGEVPTTRNHHFIAGGHDDAVTLAEGLE